MQLGGEGKVAEVDGAYVGGIVRRENEAKDRKNLQLPENQSGKRRSVVAMRERGGRTLTVVVSKESEAVLLIRQRIASGTVLHADEAAGWDVLHGSFETMRINHKKAYSLNGACTNQAESFFSRLRRAEFGQHHHMGCHLHAYAAEMAWKEDRRRRSNGENWNTLTSLAARHPKSAAWCGYWQRSAA